MGTKTNVAPPPTADKPVVVTTEHKGVFFGYVPTNEAVDVKTLKIERARMCVYWSYDVGGVVGLAAKGPSKSCKVGPAAPSITLQAVTAVMDATAEAAAAWEREPWAR